MRRKKVVRKRIRLRSDRIINISQLAKFLGVGARTVHRLVQSRQVPGFKIGKQWRFEPETIKKWVVREMGKNLSHRRKRKRRKKK